MSQNTENPAVQNLHVEELNDRFGVTEDELASASIVCSTSTCTGFSPAETATAVGAEVVRNP